MIGNTNRTSAWLNFAQRSRDEGGLGLAPHQAAGLVGNLIHESGQDLNPWGPTGDNGTAWGTAQWRNDRLARLKARPDYQTMEGQQAFMREELDGSENKAYRALLAAKTPEEAAHAWDANYERSDGSTRGQRMASARALMAQFGDDTSTPGALTSSFAPTESNKSMPALSTDNTMGTGILSASNPDDDRVAQALIGIGASLSSITNPDQAKVLASQQAALKKNGNWTHTVLPNGQLLAAHQSGAMRLIGQPGEYSKDDTYIPVHSVDPTTGLPTVRIFNKNQGTFADGGGAGGAASGPSFPGTLEELQQQNPALAAQVIGVNEGRIPYPNASRLNPQQQLLKNAVSQYFPGVDATTFSGRQTYMKNLATAQPSQPGGQYVGLGHTLDMARQLSEKALDLGNTDIGYGIGHAMNVNKDSILGDQRMSKERAAKTNAFDENVDRMASEIGRLFSGNQGGGVHERENTRNRFNTNMTPTEFGENLKAVRDMVLSRKDELLSQADALGIPHSRIPGLEKLEGNITTLNTNIDKLSGKRADTAKPAFDRSAIDAELKRRGL